MAALLFPAFTQIRERARQTQCSSNLRQIGAALGAYTGDWNEGFPPVYPYSPEGDWAYGFGLTLQPYLQDASHEIWKCPSDYVYDEQPDVLPTGNALDHSSYAPSLQFFGWQGLGVCVPPVYYTRTLDTVRSLTSTIMIGDGISILLLPKFGKGLPSQEWAELYF